jgi:hypothetical protein
MKDLRGGRLRRDKQRVLTQNKSKRPFEVNGISSYVIDSLFFGGETLPDSEIIIGSAKRP